MTCHQSPALARRALDRRKDPGIHDVPEQAENDHAEQDFDHGAGTARIEHQKADPAGADDHLDRDQRAPAIAEAVAQSGNDIGQRAG